mgnify:CR=1 FL=1
MRTTEEQHNERKREIMEKCFECYAENGLTGTGIKLWRQRVAVQREICIPISTVLMN